MGILKNASAPGCTQNRHNDDRKRNIQADQEVHDHGRYRQSHDKQDSHHSQGNSQMKLTEDA
jgi:hypothetical protein